MPPRQIPASRRAGAQQQQAGFATSLYRELRSPENTALIKSVALFAVAVTFLQSGWSEFLVPM